MMRYTITLLLFFVCVLVDAQKTTLQVMVVDSLVLEKLVAVKKEFNTKDNCVDYVQQLVFSLKTRGYITANVDTIIQKDSLIFASIYVGKKYDWQNLQLPNELNNISIQTKNIEQLPTEILNYYQNNGYPFVKVYFDSVHIDEKNRINASLKVDKGFLYELDSIRIWGDANVNHNFLLHYLNFYKTKFFNTEKLALIDDRLNKLPYVSSYKKSDVLMLNNGYVINLYLQSKKINRFDGIIGFLPNNNQTNGKLLFTLDANLNLYNAFANGENIAISWQQIQPQSPRINIGFLQPYIFNSNAQLNFNFSLYKRDSAYLNIASSVGAEYELSSNSKFSINIGSNSSQIIQPDTLQIITTKKLPQVLDYSITNLSLNYTFSNAAGLKLNKKNGWDLSVVASFGEKKIKPNNTITSLKTGGFNYNSLYDTLQANSYQIKGKVYAAKYFPVNKQSILKLAANYGFIQTKNYLQNELFQIGGFKLLRGFDEENIFTNEYVVTSAEYRYLISPSSYFFIFSDGGFTKNKILKKDYSYIGAGLGLALEIKQGILNIVFANGKRNDLPFNLRETKIHIGIVSNL